VERDDLASAEVRSFEEGYRARTPATLLELKMLLVALRLAAQPTAIVMDEPDWGLRQSMALNFVRGVIQAAHGVGIAVLLISHKPWWQDWARSILTVRKVAPDPADAVGSLFRIQVNRTMPCR
jgi:hypothetical protein